MPVAENLVGATRELPLQLILQLPPHNSAKDKSRSKGAILTLGLIFLPEEFTKIKSQWAKVC